MDREHFEQLARDAGLIEPDWHSIPIDRLPAFAVLIAEECAKLAENQMGEWRTAEAIREKFAAHANATRASSEY